MKHYASGWQAKRFLNTYYNHKPGTMHSDSQKQTRQIRPTAATAASSPEHAQWPRRSPLQGYICFIPSCSIAIKHGVFVRFIPCCSLGCLLCGQRAITGLFLLDDCAGTRIFPNSTAYGVFANTGLSYRSKAAKGRFLSGFGAGASLLGIGCASTLVFSF